MLLLLLLLWEQKLFVNTKRREKLFCAEMRQNLFAFPSPRTHKPTKSFQINLLDEEENFCEGKM
jgi:hypothetical protein